MQLSPTLRAYVASECREASDLMAKSDNAPETVFYFSAVWGALQRALNIEFSSELAHAAIVTQAVYNMVHARLEAARAGDALAGRLMDALLESLRTLTAALAGRIESEQEITDVLHAMSAVGYAATGNGFWIYQSGRLKLQEESRQ